jgi:hypothetical protein
MTPVIFLLVPVAALINILERISNSLLREQTARNYRTGDFEITVHGPTATGSNNITDTDITLLFDQTPTQSILGVCILAYFVSALGVGGIWELRRTEGTAGHQRVWGWTVLLSNIIMIGASAGVLGYASSVQSNTRAWQSYEDVGRNDQEYTRETWACQIDKFYPDEGWAGAACGIARATRLLLIPLILSSALVLVSLWILVRDRGGAKWLVGGQGRYAGFQNVYELRPTGPTAPYAAQPGPQWVPYPGQQWPQQPAQQWPQQPAQQWPQQPAQQWPQQPAQQWPQQPGQQWVPQPVQQWTQPPMPQAQKPNATVEQTVVSR